jgi:hypothetical protein
MAVAAGEKKNPRTNEIDPGMPCYSTNYLAKSLVHEDFP